MLGTAEHHLAKYLATLINENMPNKYILDSNVSFIYLLNQFSYQQNDPPKYSIEIFSKLLQIATYFSLKDVTPLTPNDDVVY